MSLAACHTRYLHTNTEICYESGSGPFSAIILAGGKSRRMGQDKALLVFRGKTLIERTVETLSGLFVETLVVGGDRSRFPCLSVDAIVPDAVPDAGPLGGLYTGLSRIRSDRAFVVACDMPLLDRLAVTALLDLARSTGAEAVVPVASGRMQPLHAVYSRACLPIIERQLAAGDYRLQELCRRLGAHFWDAGALPSGFFANVNTPEDLEKLG